MPAPITPRGEMRPMRRHADTRPSRWHRARHVAKAAGFVLASMAGAVLVLAVMFAIAERAMLY